MPTYEYECKTCGTTMDVFQSITAAPLRRSRCEACDAVRPVRRLIGTGGGVIFKGSGFYQTDYRSEGYKKAAKSETDATAKPAGESAKNDKASKPAKKAGKPGGPSSSSKSKPSDGAS